MMRRATSRWCSQTEQVAILSVVMGKDTGASTVNGFPVDELCPVSLPFPFESPQVHLRQSSRLFPSSQSHHLPRCRQPPPHISLYPVTLPVRVHQGHIDPVQLSHPHPDPPAHLALPHPLRSQCIARKVFFYSPIIKCAIHPRPYPISRRQHVQRVQLVYARNQRR